MKQLYYDVKIIFNDKIVVFFTVFFPLLLMILMRTMVSSTDDFKFKIGVSKPTTSSDPAIEMVQVEDYKSALLNNKIHIYQGDDAVYVSGYKYGQSFMIESINYYGLQQGRVDYVSNSKTTPRTVDFVAMLSMSAFYAAFLAIEIFQKYNGSNGVAARITLSNNRFKLIVKSFILCMVFQSIALILPIIYLKYYNLIQITPTLYVNCFLLMMTGTALGMMVSSFRKFSLGMRQGMTTSLVQAATFIGGGFGLPIMMYVAKYQLPFLQYLSPIHITNQLFIYGLNLFHISVLLLMTLVCLGVTYLNGGKQ